MRYKELRDLTISALVLAASFGIAFSGGYSAFSNPGSLLETCLLALVAISSGFILHEMGHRFLARRFHASAEFMMSPGGLLLALATSLFGFILAAPGAVVVRSGVDSLGRPTLTPKMNGQISVSGPLMNIILTVVFILLYVLYPTQLFSIGAYINAWLAVFNMIPFGPLDGAAVFRWNKLVWLLVLMAALGLFIIQFGL